MPRTKISEFSATPGNNTDIDGINIAEGCSPSGINDAIRELMAQLKDFQAGTAGDSFNGPIGTTTPAAGVFTNLSASGTFALTGDQVQISEGGTGQTTANAAFNALAPSQSTHAGKYLKTDGTNTSWDALDISTADITGTLPVANGGTGVTSSTGTGSVVLSASPTFTGTVNGAALTLSSSLTLSGGTANGVAYLNGSKVLTTGSALTFDGTNLSTGSGSFLANGTTGITFFRATTTSNYAELQSRPDISYSRLLSSAYSLDIATLANQPISFTVNSTEQARLTTTGLGIGTSSPGQKLHVVGSVSTGLFEGSTLGGITLQKTGTNGVQLFSDAAGVLKIYNNQTGVTAATLDSSGNLGIGTSSPAAKLTIAQSSNVITQGLLLVNAAGTQNGGWYHGGSALIGRENGVDTIALAAGNVGIGTSSPSTALDVASSNSGITLTNTAVSNKKWRLGGNAAGSFLITESGVADRLWLDTSGNLGLGVTPSAWASGRRALELSGSVNYFMGANANSTVLGSNFYADGAANRYVATGFASMYLQASSQHQWYTAPSGTAGNAISFSQVMTLDASGNLALGRTSALIRLDVDGGTNTTSGVLLRNQGTAVGLFGNEATLTGSGSSNNAVLSSYGATSLILGTNATERARITSGGLVGINTTSPNGRLEVVTTSAGDSVRITSNPGTNPAGIVYTTAGVQNWSVGVSGSDFIFQASNNFTGTERARITSGGNLLVNRTSTDGSTVLQVATKSDYGIGIASGVTTTQYVLEFRNANGVVGTVTTSGTATAYNTSSDYRLKENQQPLTGSGAFIDALQPKTWDWKSGGKGVGFIAHEVQEVSPGSVVGTKDAVDEEGKPIMQAMEYGSAEFIANIIAELQSLRARVAQLEAK